MIFYSFDYPKKLDKKILLTPDTNKDEYREEASYLNSGYPSEHETYVRKEAYAAGSKTFYIGCNTDDFMTFCLKIQRSIGKITLSHAGPNSLYNNSTICFTFGKTELDLVALEFIRLSAGKCAVPIRNVMICFEEQSDLHPKVDTDIRKCSNIDDDRSCNKPARLQQKQSEPSSPSSSSVKAQHGVGFSNQVQSSSRNSNSTSLIPCRENVNCLLQLSNEKDHNSKFSHPCRFSELCRNREANLTHEPHQAPTCVMDKDCSRLIDPHHRAQYRHTGLPDYLLPCRHQRKCDDTSEKHRIKYSHGEQVYELSSLGAGRDSTDIIPCKWGSKCRDMDNQQHSRKYSHPKPVSSSSSNSSSVATRKFH
ncbi:unnamed protein product [Adineta ricciae]|uniref:PBZ-type domain-containing protein n=1 Tax=Adineta ricciae TaxID=249248 RepID=A0A815MD78_ADIRI|nr:unnamed protein product [Adineta ricciae]